MIYSQGAGATQALSTSVTSAKANLNAGNRAAPYLLLVNLSAAVAFVRVSTDNSDATASDLPIGPNESVVIAKTMPMAAATNVTVAAILSSATGSLYITGVDIVGT
jgi:hypothetical protein